MCVCVYTYTHTHLSFKITKYPVSDLKGIIECILVHA